MSLTVFELMTLENKISKWSELVSWAPVGDYHRRAPKTRALTTELLGTSENVLKKSLAIITDLVS